ncbi:MAG: aminotransferase class V-fold PLP-dependent enzyme [Pirellulaceae bacterium]
MSGSIPAFRDLMPVARRWAYFDHAAVAPLPQPARQAISTWLDEAAEEGDTIWPRWAKRMESLRGTAAAMIHADPAEIALVPNTTTGITLVAEGFPWQSGDNVVTLANEFPSNIYPWMNLQSRGVETRLVPVDGGRVDLGRIENAMDARTRIVTISWVGYASGWRIDPAEVAALAHRRGALLFLDAIQGLGVFPLDVEASGIDFAAADGHKWMLGPEGAGLLYIRREHLDRLRPMICGWHSVLAGSRYDQIEFKLKPAAVRYEGGSQNMVGFTGLNASLEMLRDLGVGPNASPVADRVLEITDYAVAKLRELGLPLVSPHEGNHRSGIVTFQTPNADPLKVRQQLADRGIAAACRGGGIRLSPHGYAIEEEIDRLVNVLREISVTA